MPRKRKIPPPRPHVLTALLAGLRDSPLAENGHCSILPCLRLQFPSHLRPNTRARYTTAVQSFMRWCLQHSLTPVDSSAVDELGTAYCWDARLSRNDLGLLIAGLKFSVPNLKDQLQHMELARRALERMLPTTHTMPWTPHRVWFLAYTAIQKGLPLTALRFLVSYHAYLRPGECAAIKVQDVLLGVDHCVLSLSPNRWGTKNQRLETVPVNCPWLRKLLFAAVARLRPRALLFGPPEEAAAIMSAVFHLPALVRWHFTAHGARPGGATAD